MLGDDKCTFNIVAIQCASDTLRQSWKGGLSTSSGMPYSRCTIQMMIQLCRTWFSSPVTAQGLRRVKEYARLGLLSATLQLEMDHMMVFSHRWLPAAWESLNDALPKCREFRVKVDSNLMDLVLFKHLPGSAWNPPGTGKTISTGKRTRPILQALESCLCHKQKRSTKNNIFETWRDCEKFCTPYETTIPMSCIAAHWRATICY